MFCDLLICELFLRTPDVCMLAGSAARALVVRVAPAAAAWQ